MDSLSFRVSTGPVPAASRQCSQPYQWEGKETMRFGAKTMLRACFAVPVVAAVVMAGAGAANAKTTMSGVPGAVSSSSYLGDRPYGFHGPGRYFCSKWQLGRWNLNGTNSITAVYLGSDFTYTVTFEQDGSCLTGTLTDPYIPKGFPKSGPVS